MKGLRSKVAPTIDAKPLYRSTHTHSHVRLPKQTSPRKGLPKQPRYAYREASRTPISNASPRTRYYSPSTSLSDTMSSFSSRFRRSSLISRYVLQLSRRKAPMISKPPPMAAAERAVPQGRAQSTMATRKMVRLGTECQCGFSGMEREHLQRGHGRKNRGGERDQDEEGARKG